MLKTTGQVGVVLFQLGGPDTLEAIEPFLYNLFCDPDIIDFPFCAAGAKATGAADLKDASKKVQHHYAVVGGGSPIRRFTEQQASALEQELMAAGVNAQCFVAMRYWHPFTGEAIAQVRAAKCEEIVLLPLYPHYSSTTTGSSLNEWRRLFPDPIRTRVVKDFYRNPEYLDALVERIDEGLGRFARPDNAEIVFSAHSVPLSVIQKGDPYQQQIEETVEMLMERGGWRNHHRLCYQSKVGASRWLQPSLHRGLRDLAAEKVQDGASCRFRFVSDHVETLGEIDHEAREEAEGLGIRHFEMTRGLNDSPRFIRALAGLVMQAMGGDAMVGSGQAETQFVAAN